MESKLLTPEQWRTACYERLRRLRFLTFLLVDLILDSEHAHALGVHGHLKAAQRSLIGAIRHAELVYTAAKRAADRRTPKRRTSNVNPRRYSRRTP